MDLIVAHNKKRTIGFENALLYHLPKDFKHFKRTTQNTTMIMGRNTFESLPGVLPGRVHVVLSSTMPQPEDERVIVLRTLDELQFYISKLENEGIRVMLIGGAQLYATFLADCDTLYITEIDDDKEGDSYFPEFPVYDYNRTVLEVVDATETSPAYKIVRYNALK